MKVDIQDIQGPLLFKPQLMKDSRGFFYESWNESLFNQLLASNQQPPVTFVQDNHSKSSYGVLRGLHFQKNKAQGKLVRVIKGAVYDFFFDIRRDSSTFGKAFGIEINEKNKLQVWLPPGLAHGFLTLTKFAEFEYKCTNFYNSNDEYCLIWNDTNINIELPIPKEDIIVSQKDSNGLSFNELITKGII